jgi:hypothetical protein
MLPGKRVMTRNVNRQAAKRHFAAAILNLFTAPGCRLPVAR